MAKPNILIISVDGLRASSVGAYGNTSFATPALDGFAAQSFLLDACYAQAVDLPRIFRALWQSVDPMRPASGGPDGESLFRALTSQGYASVFVTDEPELLASTTSNFDEVIDLSPSPIQNTEHTRARDASETVMARLFAAACVAVAPEAETAPRLVWIHSKGMYGAWDAPLDLQQSLREEGDPPPVESGVPPDLILRDVDDPDAVFQYGCAYAAQVMVLDECYKALMAAIDSNRSEGGWLVALIGTRGFPLGEHGRVGGVDPRLYCEQLHVPWLIRFPDGLGRLARSGAMTTHFDLWPTIAEWLDETRRGTSPSADGASVLPLARSARTKWRDNVISASDSSRSIRTAAWCLRQDAAFGENLAESSTEHASGELFVRPDDRWEANDVAKLCPDIQAALTDAMDDVWQRVSRNEPVPNDVARMPSAEFG